MKKYIYYNDIMKAFGDKLVANHGFHRVTLEELNTLEDMVLFYGVYSDDDYNALLNRPYPTTLYFCGTDLVYLEQKNLLRNIFVLPDISINVGNQFQADLLRKYNVIPKISPIKSIDLNAYDVVDYPEKFQIAVYVNTGERSNIYNTDKLIEFANKHTDINFAFFGNREKIDGLKGNSVDYGFISEQGVDELLRNSHGLIRYTLWDGFPETMVRAILMGRQSFSPHSYCCSNKFSDLDELYGMLIEFKNNPVLNKTGAFIYKQPYFINNWGRIFRDMDYPMVDILIADSLRNDEWFENAYQSCVFQSYPNFRIIIEENPNKKKSIGKIFNELAQQSDSDYIFYMGDDDILTPDYIQALMDNLMFAHEYQPDVVHATTYISYINENGEMQGFSPFVPTGLWLRNFIIENPFDENLEKLVDTELIARTTNLGYKKLVLKYHFGYLYRQHGNMVSGRKHPMWEYREQEIKG